MVDRRPHLPGHPDQFRQPPHRLRAGARSSPRISISAIPQFAGITNSFLIAYTASQALSGKLYDRIGNRRGFTLSIVVWSIASMLHAFATGLFSLNCFRFLLGLGEAGNWPGAAKVIAEWFPPRQRALGMAIFNSGTSIGSVVATAAHHRPTNPIWMAGHLPRRGLARLRLARPLAALLPSAGPAPPHHARGTRAHRRRPPRPPWPPSSVAGCCCATARPGRSCSRASSATPCGGSTSPGCRSTLYKVHGFSLKADRPLRLGALRRRRRRQPLRRLDERPPDGPRLERQPRA